jgi:hypothetical protein
MYASKAQKDAVAKLMAELEAEGAEPVELNLGKPFEELTSEQQDFLFELCGEEAAEFNPTHVFDPDSKTIRKL